MAGVPTYVVGVGGAGIDVVRRFHDRTEGGAESDHVDYLAIDADERTLAETPGGIPTIHLASDSGIVDEAIAAYPYLASDTTIPAVDADRMRNVGRYKLDNPVSPGFMTHYDEIRSRLERFYDRWRSNLGENRDRFDVVVVYALGGGTGSGVLPLLATMLTDVGQQLNDGGMRLRGVGIVPPLGIDPEYSAPPTEPVTYPNTYGALRNLSTLFDASREQPIEVPAYSLSETVDGAVGDGESTRIPSEVCFEVADAPFDSHWLVSLDHGASGGAALDSQTEDVSSMVAAALRSLAAHRSSQIGSKIWSRMADCSPFGTVGYGALAVPHESLRRYCERKRDRAEARRRLEEVIEPKVEELRRTRDELTAVLAAGIDERSPEVVEHVEQIRERLDGSTELDGELVTENDPEAIDRALGDIADEGSPRDALAASRSLRWALSDGPVGSDLRSELERIWAEVRAGYEFQLVPERIETSMALERRLEALRQGLVDQIRYCEVCRAEADSSVRDLLPPTHAVFTSERERLARLIGRLEDDLDRVENALHQLDALLRAETLVEERVAEAKEMVRSRLDETEAYLEHFETEYDEVDDRLDDLDRELTRLRGALTDPDEDGPVRALPLSLGALDGITLDAVETELTSIAAYRDRNLLAVEDHELERSLERCLEYSRGWPDAIANHDASVSMSSQHDETMVLYHRANEPLTESFLESLTGPDTVHTPATDGLAHTDDPYRIEIVSIAQGGEPESLVGFQRLDEMARDGTFDAMAGPYRDFRRALAYPEWYDLEIQDGRQS